MEKRQAYKIVKGAWFAVGAICAVVITFYYSIQFSSLFIGIVIVTLFENFVYRLWRFVRIGTQKEILIGAIWLLSASAVHLYSFGPVLSTSPEQRAVEMFKEPCSQPDYYNKNINLCKQVKQSVDKAD